MPVLKAYTVEIQADVDLTGIDTDALAVLAERALSKEAVASPAELSILLTDDAAVQELNRQYRNTDAPTDVLSFAQAEGDTFAHPDAASALMLGDIIISIDTARRQAAEYAVTLQDEVAHLLVHGILHLLGYDHEVPDEADIMRAHEDAILGTAHHH